VRNEEVLHGVKEKRDILHTVKRRKASCIGHILGRNCLIQHVMEGKVEGRIVTARREEDVSSYWINFRKRDTANSQGKH